jgi:hypothetical protein
MAEQTDTFGFDISRTWAFGPGARPVAFQPVSVDDGNGYTAKRSEYQQPAVFPSGDETGRSEYEQPAVFPSGDQTAAHRDVWDQLPPERRRRARQYVGKHRA